MPCATVQVYGKPVQIVVQLGSFFDQCLRREGFTHLSCTTCASAP